MHLGHNLLYVTIHRIVDYSSNLDTMFVALHADIILIMSDRTTGRLIWMSITIAIGFIHSNHNDFGVSVGMTVSARQLLAWHCKVMTDSWLQTINRMHLTTLTLLVLYHEYNAVMEQY